MEIKLPIFRQKYVEETPDCARWFLFGNRGNNVDISNGKCDVFIDVPLGTAINIINIRDKFVNELSKELELDWLNRGS